ncbi:hypothetical protein SAMN05421882_103525 [Nitrosomonas communis]|uniref:Uncharacterized protein n=1 Tax=Nitrosomonas communis TaxID=44574 RepID=A0A1H2X8N5_9PROT|nr:hypothetical protein SAMN05421882_103525 [Nitrosomonas communis]
MGAQPAFAQMGHFDSAYLMGMFTFGNRLKEVRQSLAQWFDWCNQECFDQNLDNQIPDEVYYQYTIIYQAISTYELYLSEPNPILRL